METNSQEETNLRLETFYKHLQIVQIVRKSLWKIPKFCFFMPSNKCCTIDEWAKAHSIFYLHFKVLVSVALSNFVDIIWKSNN